MKKQLLLAIIVLGTLNNVSGMDVIASESPELWKQKRNIELQKLAHLKEKIEDSRRKQELYSYSSYNLFSYFFCREAYSKGCLAFWKEQEQESANRMKVILTNHTEEDLLHEKNLFGQHLEIVDSEISQLAAEIKEEQKKLVNQQVMNDNIPERANLVEQKKRLVTEQNLLSSSKVQHYKRFYRSHTQKSYRDLVAQE